MPQNKEQDPLVGVVVVTHGRAADELVAAAHAILGRIPLLVPASIDMGDAFDAMVQRISRACDEADLGAGVLVLVDVHGSSPFHAAMSMMDGTRPVEVLCGVNLPMLIKMTTMDRCHAAPVALAEKLRDVGRRSIRLGSELTGKVVVGGQT